MGRMRRPPPKLVQRLVSASEEVLRQTRTTTGGHRHTDRLSSRNALLPLLWPRRPGRVPAGRAPARRRRDNRARRHNRPATRRPAALSDNRARRVPRGQPEYAPAALLRGSHRTTRNPHGREGRDARRATRKLLDEGAATGQFTISDSATLPTPSSGCIDRYAHPLGRWPRHTRSRVSAGTDRPTRQERRTRPNKRAPTGLRAGHVPGDGQQDWPVRLRDDEIAGSKPAPDTATRHARGWSRLRLRHGTILHNFCPLPQRPGPG